MKIDSALQNHGRSVSQPTWTRVFLEEIKKDREREGEREREREREKERETYRERERGCV